jgi:hypothetical protein
MNMPIESFKENGFCIVKNAISSELRDFVTQYALFDEMQSDGYRDKQVPNAYAKYGDPAMESMLLHLKTVLEENTGLTLHPTYSYYRVYRDGDVLLPHKDRESCEISATMCLNYNYDDTNFDWPIFIDGNKVVLKPGDLAIYRGCDLSHWRDQFKHTDDVWHVQGFFHFVDANGPCAEFKYDKRNSIGEVKRPVNTSNVLNRSYISYTK